MDDIPVAPSWKFLQVQAFFMIEPKKPSDTALADELSRESSGETIDELSTPKFLKISETYSTLQGEGSHSGLPCYFIRLAVCDIRCSWCDTPDSWTGGEWQSLQELLSDVPEHIELVQITGGEPLLQIKRLSVLMDRLNNMGKKILLETGGHRSLENVPSYVHVVMDIKLPSSGETGHDFEANFIHLKKSDEIKFVVAGESDFLAALDWVQRFDLSHRFQILISPVAGLDLKKLAQWMLDSKLTMRLQLQLHKYIWGPDARMV
ncbi:MAG TPA: 7-carboxy-7-deazaguanine synthase [Leptospiraceae bacterium]|nr:7-carboxy-7-deazaguanine synthase [Spirochaetaceae bacterium]HBS06562.1 7-carboxy-7-deazaguanine synthase [Leptospiraceae bacterium]|tara:strand:+ start:215955 stop:216743 length:789 start_codon:yes stop_codon:yes gene_type:complete